MNRIPFKKIILYTLGLTMFSFVTLIILSMFIVIENNDDIGADFSPLFHCSDQTNATVYNLSVSPKDIFNQDDLMAVEDTCGYDDSVFYWDESTDEIHFDVYMEEADDYHMAIDYLSMNDTVIDNAITVLINGELQTEYAENMRLLTLWENENKSPVFDSYNNQVLSRQTPLKTWNHTFLQENLMLNNKPVTFSLEEGENTITLQREAGEFLLGNLYFTHEEEFLDYEYYLEQYDSQMTSGHLLSLNATNSTFKNDISIRYDRVRTVNVSPYSSEKSYINVVGDAFSQSGQEITYAIEVPESGYYNLTMKYRNHHEQNISAFRNIRINGEIPFEDAHGYEFSYQTRWQNETLGDDEAYQFYFEEGINTLSIEVDGSLMGDSYYRILEMLEEITELSLEVNKLTGGVDDMQREWNIDRYLPHAEDQLDIWLADIDDIIDDIHKLSSNDESSNSYVRQLINAQNKLQEIRDDINRLPNDINDLSEGNNSIARTLSVIAEELINQPMSIDQIHVHSNDVELPRENANIFVRLIAWTQRIIQVSDVDTAQDDEIEIWVNRSRFYVDLMQQMADTQFTPQTGIDVKFSVMPDESKLIMANAAGTQPDIALGVSGQLPYELGLRGAAVDLRQFDEFNETLTQFSPGSILHMMHDDRVYGLPETQDFNVTVYRTDILEQVNLDVPDTYSDIIGMLPTLQRYGMNYYLPLSLDSGLKPIAVTAPFIYQHGGDLYTDDAMRTAVDQEEAIEAIDMMVDLYTVYSLPLQTPNFYDAFRSGRIPIGTSNFDDYIRLLFAAPELVNKWDVALAPGVMQEDGTIRRDNPGTAQSAMMFENSNRHDDSWKFLNWWLSTEVQAEFAYDLQAIYGREFMWNSANIEAFKTLPIEQEHIDVIIEQWEWLHEVPRTPGGYTVEREISNIWNKVVFDSENLRVAIDDATLIMNRELRRKFREFGYVDADGQQVRPYALPDIETVREWQKEGSK